MKNDDQFLGPELPVETRTTRILVRCCLSALLITAVVYVILIVSFHLSYN